MLDMEDVKMEQVQVIDDKDWCNFDHIPIWYEPVGSYYWDPKYSGSRNVKNGGKDNIFLTVVLTISKLGEKLITFII